MEQKKTPAWWNDWTIFKYHFARSTYITVAWNWLLVMLSKAAEPFLFATALYSGYELLPHVPRPAAGLDAAVFVGQLAALDIGGMGLMKQAQTTKQGRRSFAYGVGIVLVSLMIANMVVATIERLAPLGNAGNIIEGILLVIRAVMAVLYGYAVHSLRDDEAEPTAVVKVVDVHAQLKEFQAALSRSEELHREQWKQVIEAMPQMESRFQSHLDTTISSFSFTFNERAEAVVKQLSLLAEMASEIARVEAGTQENLIQVESRMSQVQAIVEQQSRTLPRQIERMLSEQRPQPVVEQNRPIKKLISLPSLQQDASFNRRQFVFDCLNEDRHMKLEDMIARALNEEHTLAMGSASKYRTEYFQLHPITESEAVGE